VCDTTIVALGGAVRKIEFKKHCSFLDLPQQLLTRYILSPGRPFPLAAFEVITEDSLPFLLSINEMCLLSHKMTFHVAIRGLTEYGAKTRLQIAFRIRRDVIVSGRDGTHQPEHI
jgi:hypothetical protein